MLELNAPGVWITLLADQVSLNPGGFDGRQRALSWDTEAGRASAMLTGEADLRVLRRLAPPALVDQIERALGLRQRRSRRLRGWLSLKLLVALLGGLALVLL